MPEKTKKKNTRKDIQFKFAFSKSFLMSEIKVWPIIIVFFLKLCHKYKYILRLNYIIQTSSIDKISGI